MQYLVTIIIPYFNRPEKLERCLNSIFSQTYTCYEIIVVDDCSTKPPQLKHENVTYLKNQVNSGPGLSRNLGKDISKGEFIAFLDCDDYWHKDFLQSMVNSLLSSKEVVMTYAEGFLVNESNTIIGKRKSKKNPPNCILPEILFKGRYWGTGGCLWRKKEIVDVQFVDTRSWEDYVFDISIALRNNCVLPVNKYLVYYDISGIDKLSNQQHLNIIVEKHASINIISKILFKSQFKNNSLIIKKITVLLLLNIVQLLKLKIDPRSRIFNSIKSINCWQAFSFSIYVLVLSFLPKRIAIKYIMGLKRKVNQDRINFLR